MHSLWGEINTIRKTNLKDEKEFLFQRKSFETYLKTLSNEVSTYLENFQSVEKFHLFLDGECLWIVLKINFQTEPHRFFMIKELQEHKNLFNFVKILAKTKSLISIDVPDGYTSASLLSHLNMPIKSQLALLFFNGWSSEQMHFKGNIIRAKNIENYLYIPDLLDELSILHNKHQSRYFSPPIDAFLQSIHLKQ